MKLIPAPGRQFKTYSMWLVIGIGVFDAVVLLMKTLGDMHVMSAETVLTVNAVLATATVIARLVHQQISATTEQKTDLIESVAAQPIKAGDADIQVKVNDQTVANQPPKE